MEKSSGRSLVVRGYVVEGRNFTLSFSKSVNESSTIETMFHHIPDKNVKLCFLLKRYIGDKTNLVKNG